MIVVIYYYQFCFQRATRENTFHSNWCHPLKIKVIYIIPLCLRYGHQTRYKSLVQFQVAHLLRPAQGSYLFLSWKRVTCYPGYQRFFPLVWRGASSAAGRHVFGLRAWKVSGTQGSDLSDLSRSLFRCFTSPQSTPRSTQSSKVKWRPKESENLWFFLNRL